MTAAPQQSPTVGVGVVCLRGSGAATEVLLVRRGRPPRAGEWSLPGGRLELGERLADGALRELKEETGVDAELLGLIDAADGLFPGAHYVLIDYAARWQNGEPVAGDDAAEAAFLPVEEAVHRVAWSETARVIRAAIERFGR